MYAIWFILAAGLMSAIGLMPLAVILFCIGFIFVLGEYEHAKAEAKRLGIRDDD